MGSLYNVRAPVHNRTYGIELECLLVRKDIQVLPQLDTFWQFWFFTTDGSIRDNYPQTQGYEIISQPMPKDMLINQINRLWKKTGGWIHNNSCGIHIHVSRKMFDIQRAMVLRKHLQILTREQTKHLFGRESGTYCDPRSFGKYNSVNTEHNVTIELRMFSSGDAEWAKECVRRADLLVRHRGDYKYETMCALFGLTH